MKEFLITVAQAEDAIRSSVPVLQMYTKDRTSVYFMKKTSMTEHELFHKLKGFELYSTEENDYIKTLIARGTFSLESYTKKIYPEVVLKDAADQAFEDAMNWTYSYSIVIPDEDENQEEKEEVPEAQKSKKKKRGYNVQFFPIGAFFTRSRIVTFVKAEDIPPEVYCVKDIVRNGEDSYVIRTTTPSKIPILSDQQESFNIGWVEKILERGDVFAINKEKGMFTSNKHVAKYVDDMREIYPQYHKKGHWLCYSIEDIIHALLRDVRVSEHAVVAAHSLGWLLRDQSFVKCINIYGYYGSTIYVVNKKRAKRFVQQNQNKFLRSAHKTQLESDRVMYEDNFDYDDWPYDLPAYSGEYDDAKEPEQHNDSGANDQHSQFD